MFREHICASEFRALFHQFRKRLLAIRTDERYVPEIDDQLAALQLLSRAFEGTLNFSGPRRDQLAFQDQPSLRAAFDDGNPEQWAIDLRYGKSTTGAMRDCARDWHKSLNRMGYERKAQQEMSRSVEAVIDNCRRMSNEQGYES